ncbi:unnamed protein product [Ranitomeya imitator]|uniref:Uncharacterized protein n=1 Tax=Ranitomeya imitator TaxID=111125 RepID=A0ABN9MNK1_9NEOB|nr:unnamed protein product [Ranitomeya imitator]
MVQPCRCPGARMASQCTDWPGTSPDLRVMYFNAAVMFRLQSHGRNTGDPETTCDTEPPPNPAVITGGHHRPPGADPRAEHRGGTAAGERNVYSMPAGHWAHTLQDDQSVAQRLPVTALRFQPCRPSSRGELLLATYASGRVKFWHVSTQSCVRSLTEERQTLAAAFSPSRAAVS